METSTLAKKTFLLVCLLLLATSFVQAQTLEDIFDTSMTPIAWGPTDSPSNEGVNKAIDGSSGTKFLNFNRSWGAAFIVNTGELSIVKSITITTANDFTDRDPKKVQVYGRYVADGVTPKATSPNWILIDEVSFRCRDLAEARRADHTASISNNSPYNSYAIRLYNACGGSDANSVQISEVQLQGIFNQAPSVTFDATTTGSPKVASAITAAYDYTDPEDNPETGTTYQWYIDDTAIDGATGVSYTPSVDDLGKELKVEITPSDGVSSGTTVLSSVGTVACQEGFTCEVQNVSVCDDVIYQVPGGDLVSLNGTYEVISGTVRTYYNVSFDRTDIDPDVYKDAIIANTGSVTYQANTSATGVLEFDKGEDRWVNLNSLADDLANKSRSIFMWVQSEDNVASSNQALFGINTSSGGNVSILFIDNDGDNIEVNDGSNNRSASFNMSDQLWHYVGYTYDVNTNETIVYIDGIENARFTNNQVADANAQYSLGQEFDNSNDSDHFNSLLTEVSVWDEVLSPLDIKEAMKAKITNGHPKFANLVGYYSVFGACDDDTSILKDHSGKGNDGALVNFAVDFKNIQPVDGFNAIDWYDNLSWKKDGAEVSTASTFTTELAAGNYEFTATRNFIKSTDTWSMTLNSNAATADHLADETLCADDAITRTVTDVNFVDYLDLEETEDNFVEVNSVADDLVGKSRSVFLWFNKESNIGSGAFDNLFVLQNADVDDESRFYVRSTEKLALWDGDARINSSTALSNGTWYHVGYTYDHGTGEAKLYVNGVAEDQGTLDMPVTEGWFASLGQRYEDNGDADHADGKMAEITVWDKVLSQEEVTALLGAAPAHNSANLVAFYGTHKSLADNVLRDLTANGNDGLVSHASIIVTDAQEELAGYDATNNNSFSWKNTGTEFDTDATANISIVEGTTNYTVEYGSPLFQKTDAFALSYTNLLATQPKSQTGAVSTSVSFVVDEIPGATYQWYKKELKTETVDTNSGNSFPSNVLLSVFESNGTLYAGTSNAGLAILEKDATTWQVVESGDNNFPNNTVRSIFESEGNLYVGTSSGLAILESGKTTWQVYKEGDNGFPDSFVFSVHESNGTVYAGTNLGGLAILESGETTWQVYKSGDSNFPANKVNSVYASNGTVYAGTDGGGLAILKSGETVWQVYGQGDSNFPSNKVISVYESKGTVYAATNDGGLAILKSGETTWQVYNTDNSNFPNNKVFSVSEVNGTIYAGTFGGGLAILNSGATDWDVYNTANDNFIEDELQEVFVSNGSIYTATFGAGLAISQDRTPLTNSSEDNQIEGATTHQLTLNSLAIDQDACEYFVIVSKDGCEQTSANATLTVVEAPILLSFTPTNGSTDVDINTGITLTYEEEIKAGTGRLRIFDYETDTEKASSLVTVSGMEASIAENTFTLDNDTKYYVKLDANLVLDGDDNASFAITDKDFWTFTTECEPLILTEPEDQSVVVGATATFSVPEVAGASYQWYEKRDPVWNVTDTNSGVGFPDNSVRFVLEKEGTIYVGTWLGLAILKPGTENWEVHNVARGNGFPNDFVDQITVDNGTIYAATGGGLAILKSGTTTWEVHSTTSGTNFPHNTIAKVVLDNGNVYAATQEGLAILKPGASVWEVTNTSSGNGFPADNVWDVSVLNGTIYVGLRSFGMAVLKAGESTWKRYDDGIVDDFAFPRVTRLHAVSDTEVYILGSYLSTQQSYFLGVFNPETEVLNIEGGPNGSPLPTFNGSINRVFTNSNGIYLATLRGLEVLRTGSTTWEQQTAADGLANGIVTDVHESNGVIYASTTAGLAILTENVALEDIADNTADNQVQGATTATLTINNVTADQDQKQYIVVVSKGNCMETSNTVNLTVSPVPPLVTALSPTDDEIDVPRFTEPQITFDHAISKGTGNIEVRRASDDQLLTSIQANSVLVSINDKTATLKLGDTNFEFGTEYYITIPEGAFTSSEGGVFEGITDKTSWSFTIVDAPAMVSSTPADDATDVDAGINQAGIENAFSFVFNQDMEFGIGGSFDLYKAEGDELVGKTINSSLTNFSIQIADDNRTVQMFFVDPLTNAFDPTQAAPVVLESGTEYYILTSNIPFFDFSITDKTTWNFTTAQTELMVSSLSPADDATKLQPDELDAGLPTVGNFRITFDQPIAFNNTDAAFELYTAADDQLVAKQTLASTISGPAIGGFSSLGFAFASYNFRHDTEYYILVDADMVKSKQSGLPFAGISDKTTWSFKTAGPPFPWEVGLPSTNYQTTGTDVPVKLNDFQIGFFRGHILALDGVDEGFTPTNQGKIGLYTSADDQLVYELDLSTETIITDPENEGGLGKVNLFNMERTFFLLIDDDFIMNSNTQYYWLVDQGIALSPEGGKSQAIDDKTFWTFTTETVETQPLIVNAYRPVSDETLDLDRDEISIRFNEHVAAGSGTLTIFKGSDDSVFETFQASDIRIRNTATISNAILDLTESFELEETYYVQYSAGFVKSADGTKSIAEVNDKTTFQFSTGALGTGIFESFFPATGSTDYDASRGKDFEIFFTDDIGDDEVEPTGGLRIYRATDNQLIKTIMYDGENEGDLDYPSENDELSFAMEDALQPDTEYYVLIDDGFIVKLEDGVQYMTGISDPTTWRFRTAALPAEPILISSNPATTSMDIPVTTDIVLTFSENVNPGFFGEAQAVTHVILYDADNNEVERFATNLLSISGAKVTIDPSADLNPMRTYYVLIDEGAFVSNNDKDFAGITDANTLRFTTGAIANTAPVASAQDFSGSLEVKDELTGSYTYSDSDNDPEAGTAFQWYKADDAVGNNRMLIAGATTENFTLTAEEEGSFIALAITPSDGEDAGNQVFTDYKGPVAATVIPTLVSTSPLDDAVDVATNASLTFTFSEPVSKGTSGQFRYTTASGTGSTTLGISSSDISINGATVTIATSPFGLQPGEFYTVTFDAEAFVDADGNHASGLTSTTAWNFTTAPVNTAPVASGVNIKKSLTTFGDLEGSYSFSDDDGDAESGSTFQWYLADDASGTGKTAITGANDLIYTTLTNEEGKYLSFEVTPNDGTDAGAAEESNFFGPIITEDGTTNIPPAFTSDAITSIFDNESYSYTITYEDANDDSPVLTKTSGPDWLSVAGFVLSGTPDADDLGEFDLILTLDDQNGGTVTQEFTVTVNPTNTAPVINGIELDGATTIDQVLTGSYNFLDDDGDNDNSTLKWYRADDVQGTNKVAIEGVTGTTYTLTTADAGKFISFEVTPNDSKVDGTVAETDFEGPVAKKVPTLTFNNISKTYGDADFDLAAETNSSGAVSYAFDNDQTGASLTGATVTLGNVGEIAVDVALAEDAEYQARMVSGTITVAKKTVEFTATDATKSIGENDPELTFTATSGEVIGGDAVVTITRDAGETAGTYAMTFTEGADAGNYDISTVEGTFTINQIALTISADAKAKTYGETDPEFTYSITAGALAEGDELSGALTREAGEEVGTYALENGLFNSKYDITFVSADLTIDKADLSITVDDQARNFGEANPEFTLSFDGLTNGDAASDFDTPPVASTSATEASAPGTYDITLNTPADANYNITGTTNGILTVNGQDIGLTIADVSANEDDGDITVTVVLDNAVSGGFTVDASTADGTATAGTDYTAIAGQTLTFAGTAGEEQTFMITPTADFTQESDEALTVSLSNLAGTVLPIDITDVATVTIANDDVDADLFIITFETTADNEAVNLPTSGSGYNYGIDWGDGSIDFGVTGDKEHTYATAGVYTVRITGDFPRIYFKGAEDPASDANALKIKSIEQWGSNSWASMNGAFEGAMNMVINATDVPDLSGVFNMEEMFSDCDALTNDDFSAWNVSTVTNMKEMFERADNFNGNISNWNVSNVTNMEQMFKNAISFNGDITGWNTGNVEDMSQMFRLTDAAPANSEMSFNQDINSWDVSAVTDFSRMFEDNDVFNQDLNNWDVSRAEDMSFMFRRTDVFNGDISDWDVSSVTEMQNMFGNALVFNQDISGWDVSAVERMDEMFDGALLFNANIRNWDVSSVENMEQMFEDTDNFNADISIWQTTSLTNMEGMFLRAAAFNQDISGWDISGLTSLKQVFENADAFNQDLSGWSTGSITDMSSLFEEADLFNQDLSGWDVSAVTTMEDAFLNAAAFDQSLADWSIGMVSNMDDMLSGSGLSVANYDATLTAWAGQTVQNGVTLGATGLEYCASLTDRQSLISNDGWSIDGDSQACETVVTITDVGAVEDDGDIMVTVTSSNAIIGGFTLDVTTADGTATAGTDYTAVVSQTLTFAGTAGEEQTFIFSPTADSDDEPNETVTVSMSNLVVAAGNTVDITDQGTITIFNEDVAEAFFTTIWETTSDNEAIIIPTEGDGYNFRIDWGDGTIEKNQTGEVTHTYATAGNHTVKIVGSFPRIKLGDNESNAKKLKSVEQWGTIVWMSMEGAFANTQDLVIKTGSNPDLSQVTSMASMFYNADGFNSDISAWDVSKVTDFTIMFSSTDAFNQDISAWDMSAATTLRGMFSETDGFNQDISAWNVSNVENMFTLFQNANVFNQPLNDWNVGKVTNMSRMFNGADVFNQNLNSWNTANVENFKEMFRNATVFDGNIGAWDVSEGTDFEAMFEDAHAFNQNIGTWNLAKAEALNAMFRDARLFNQDIGAWRFPSANKTERMFYEAAAFNQDISSWEMGRITDISSMFESATSFNQDVSAWDVSNVDDFSWTFGRASAFNQNISSWDVSKGTSFSSMFREVAVFDQDLSDWDVTSATSMSSMFDNAGLSVANYDAILTAWAKQDVQRDVELGVEGLQYCAGSNGRQSLIDIKNWTIQNDGVNCATTLTIEDVLAAEDDGDITVTIMSSSFVADGFTVDVTTADGTATAGEDYTALTSETVTFFGAAGETQTFTITPTRDIDAESDETLTVSMDNVVTGANNTITATDQATVTIQNDDAAAFITTWNARSTDYRRGARTYFNASDDHTYKYNVDWGDGTVDFDLTGDADHIYANEGNYTVKVTGQFPKFETSSRLLSVEQWGAIEWESMELTFANKEIDFNATDVPDLSKVTSMEAMFRGGRPGNLDLTGWDVSNVTNMFELFKESDFNGDISNWDVSNVTNMSYMFAEAEDFNVDISAWNTGKVEDMSFMFNEAKAFNQDIGAWDVSSVTTLKSMFHEATVFNQDLNSWDVSNVTTMESTFQEAEAFNGDLTAWDVSNTTNMSSTFGGAKVFNQDISTWNVSNVTNMGGMFSRASVFNHDLDTWDVSNVTNFSSMFNEALVFNGDITNWDTSNADKISHMFEETEAFNQDIGNWDLSNVQNLTGVFREAIAFNQDIGRWRFPKADRLQRTFDGAISFNQDISSWETGNIIDFQDVFSMAAAFNQDISGWDVSSVTNFDDAFDGATSFDQDLSSWDISSGNRFTDIFDNAGLSIENYDKILIGWAQLADLSMNESFGAEGLQYCAGAAARQSLIDTYNWNFDSDAQSCSATVTIADVSGNEDDGDITVTLTLDAFVVDGFTVDVSTVDGTASAGSDYTAVTSHTITFAGTVGETQTFTVTPTADTNVEGNETLTVSMGNLVTGAENTVTITDDAAITIIGDDQPVLGFTAISASNSEAVTSSAIEVTLDQAGLSTITVDYAVTGAATGSGIDYTLANGSLSFAAGDVSENINLAIIDDAIVEANETVIITLSNVSGASIGTNSSFTYTIENDDEATVSLSAVSAGEGDGPITLAATLDNEVDGGFKVDLITAESSAVKGTDYTGLDDVTLTFAGTAGETQSTIITIIDDEIIEFDESISVLFDNLANTSLSVTTGDVVEVTISDNDQATVTIADVSQAEDGEAFLVTATLDKAVVGGFTVEVSTTDGTAAIADGDYTALSGRVLTFTGTAGESQTFDISPVADSKLEADESFTVSMSNLAGTTLPVTISDQATMTITNDDAAAITIEDVSGNEGDGPITLTATLDNAVQGGFTVNAVTADGTATVANNDYTALTAETVTFAGTAGETQTFTVVPTNDIIIEGDENLTVSLSNLSTDLAVDITDGATVTIVNDDFNNFPTDIILSATSIAENNALDATIGSLSTTDADAGDTHTYSLVAGAGADDNGSFIIDGSELKANNTSFNHEAKESYTVRIQTDDGAGGIFAKAVIITITDVNEAPFQISISNNTITESDDAQDVGMLMTLDPDDEETFTYELTAGEQDTHNAQFEIVGNTVRTAGAIDFEEGATRDFRIRATDSGGLTIELGFTIQIENVTEEPVRPIDNEPDGEVKNVFSPNGDGVNETWVIEDLQDNPVNEVRVFAQGGKLLYSQTNYQNDWGGTFKGDPIPDGTYYYEIIIFANSQANTPARIIKGFLTIIRNR